MGRAPGFRQRAVDHLGVESHLFLRLGHGGERDRHVKGHPAVQVRDGADAVMVEQLQVHPLVVLTRQEGQLCAGVALAGPAAVAGYDCVLPVGEGGQPGAVQGGPPAAVQSEGDLPGAQFRAVARVHPVFEPGSRLQTAVLQHQALLRLPQAQIAADPGSGQVLQAEAHFRRGAGQGQVAAARAHLDLQHRDQLHIAAAVGVRWQAGVHIVETGVIQVFDLALGVVRPVEHVIGVAELVGVGGTQLQLDVGRIARPQVLYSQGEWRGFGEKVFGRDVGGEVQAVNHPVSVVVQVEDVGLSVAVQVPGSVRAARLVPLVPVGQPVLVGIERERVGVPGLAGVAEAVHLIEIGDAVQVRIEPVRCAVPVQVQGLGAGADHILLVIG